MENRCQFRSFDVVADWRVKSTVEVRELLTSVRPRINPNLCRSSGVFDLIHLQLGLNDFSRRITHRAVVYDRRGSDLFGVACG